jgi:putative ABC transport system substrate-binding protein
MKRRDLLPLLAALAAMQHSVGAAQERRIPVVGGLSNATPERTATLWAVIHKALAEAGFVEGRTLKVEYRFAGSDPDRFPALAADLVARRVDVLFAPTNPAAIAAKAATTRIPIVFAWVNDPVELGLVEHLNRPGGNITGIATFDGPSLLGKRLQMLHEVVPTAPRIGFLAVSGAELEWLAAAGETLGVEVILLTEQARRNRARPRCQQARGHWCRSRPTPPFFLRRAKAARGTSDSLRATGIASGRFCRDGRIDEL